MSSASGSIVEAIDSLSRSQSIENHIFGRESSLFGNTSQVANEISQRTFFTDVVDYKVIILLFILLYIVWIGRSLANLSGTTFKISNPFAKITEMQGLVKSVKMGDVMLDWTLVIALCTLFATRIIDLTEHLHPDIAGLVIHINNMGVWLWMALVAAIFMAMLIWSIVMVSLSCFLMRCEPMMQELFRLKSRLLKMSVIWILPVALLSSMEHNNLFASYLTATVAVIFVFIYLFRSYLLFMSQKISILHWFLYLCTVEILPITLLWALFVRS